MSAVVVPIGKHVNVNKTKTSMHRKAFDLLSKIKPNADMVIVVTMLEGVIEAQALREKARKEFMEKRHE